MRREVKYVELPEKRLVIAIGDKSKGYAKCSDNDEFDVQFGRDLARKRMIQTRICKDMRDCVNTYAEIEECIRFFNQQKAKILDRVVYLENKSVDVEREIASMLED